MIMLLFLQFIFCAISRLSVRVITLTPFYPRSYFCRLKPCCQPGTSGRATTRNIYKRQRDDRRSHDRAAAVALAKLTVLASRSISDWRRAVLRRCAVVLVIRDERARTVDTGRPAWSTGLVCVCVCVCLGRPRRRLVSELGKRLTDRRTDERLQTFVVTFQFFKSFQFQFQEHNHYYSTLSVAVT